MGENPSKKSFAECFEGLCEKMNAIEAMNAMSLVQLTRMANAMESIADLVEQIKICICKDKP